MFQNQNQNLNKSVPDAESDAQQMVNKMVSTKRFNIGVLFSVQQFFVTFRICQLHSHYAVVAYVCRDDNLF